MERSLHIVESSFGKSGDAVRIAENLVSGQLAACAQISGGCRSWYRWDGEVIEDAEVVLRLKVRGDRLDACCKKLQEQHPYEVPMILAWPVTWVDPTYLDWAYGEDVH